MGMGKYVSYDVRLCNVNTKILTFRIRLYTYKNLVPEHLTQLHSKPYFIKTNF